MAHLSALALERVIGGVAGSEEVGRATDHLLVCPLCRTRAAGVIERLVLDTTPSRRDDRPRLIYEILGREREQGIEKLVALAEWSHLRRLDRPNQRKKVRLSKACHSLTFLDLLVDSIRTASPWEEAEWLASLALLLIETLSAKQLGEDARNDLRAEVYVEVANARRIAAEWRRAEGALAQARALIEMGTHDPLLEARFLSIVASTQADQGQVQKAVATLLRSQKIFEELTEWHLVGRSLIQLANIWVGSEPGKALDAVERAVPFIPADDPFLSLLSELLRVECLIELNRPAEALRVYRQCSSAVNSYPKMRIQIRGRFTGARLLNALGYLEEAERLFEDVVAGDIQNDLFKDAFLDLLYLFGVYLKRGDIEKAAKTCRRALTNKVLAAFAHPQLRDLWSQLLEATQRRAVDEMALNKLREYLTVYWKHPPDDSPPIKRRPVSGK